MKAGKSPCMIVRNQSFMKIKGASLQIASTSNFQNIQSNCRINMLWVVNKKTLGMHKTSRKSDEKAGLASLWARPRGDGECTEEVLWQEPPMQAAAPAKPSRLLPTHGCIGFCNKDMKKNTWIITHHYRSIIKLIEYRISIVLNLSI